MDALPPIVLLHGWGGSFKATWGAAGWVEALEAAGRSIVRLDLPGHGGPASHDPADYADMAGAVEAKLPDGVLDVVGFSLGAKLALAIATRRPGRFRRMVLGGVGDNLFAPEPQGAAVAAALENGVGDDTPAPVAGLVRYALGSGGDPRAMAAVLRRPAGRLLVETDLARLPQALLVNGEADAIALPDARLLAAAPSLEAMRPPAVDHLSLPSAPAFKAAALAFLNSGTHS